MTTSTMKLNNEKTDVTQGAIERFFASTYTLGGVLTLALILRIGHVLSLRSLPLFNKLWLDSEVYDQWAQRITSGDWLGGEHAFFIDPLYSYTLAIVYKFFGHDLLVVRLLQAGLGCATCALVALIGYRITNNKAVGTVGAFLLAVYEPAIYHEAQIEKTALGVFLITAALAFAIKRERISCFFAGALLVLATLTRGNLILLVPLGALYFLLSFEAHFDNKVILSSWSHRLFKGLAGKEGKNALAFLMGSIMILSAPLLRNHYVSGEWILTTSMAGQNFYTGNNPYNDIGAYKPLPFVRAQSLNEEPDFQAMAEHLSGKKLSPSEVSSFWFGEAIKHIVENPLFALTVFTRKFFLFWSNVEIPDAWDMYFLRRYSPVLNLPLLNFSVLLMFAAIGAATCYKKYIGVRLLIYFITAYSITVILFFMFSRYRIYAVPALAVLTSLGLHWILINIKERNWLKILKNMVLSIFVFIFSYMGSLTFGYYARESVNSFTLLAELYRKRGDFLSSESLLNEALVKFNNDPSTLQSLGLLFATQGDLNKALYYFAQCVRKDETYPEALFYLGYVQESLGKTSDARKSYMRQLEYLPNHEASKDSLSRLNRTNSMP